MQRDKTTSERVREEVILSNPEESHRRLVEHRQKQSMLDESATIKITGVKRRNKISKAKMPLLNAVLKVLEERKKFWPLSDRSIHYALLNNPPLLHASKSKRYANNQSSYNAVTDLLTRARLEGTIPWHAIGDATRPMVVWGVHREVGAFVGKEFDGLLKGYFRDLMQSQPNHIEIVGEKNTIESVIRGVAGEYTIPFTIGRGYCSLPPRRQIHERFRRSGKTKLILLMLTDFDPEGEDIASSFARSMRDDFGIDSVMPYKVALTKEQTEVMQLPPQLKAKISSSRFKVFNSKFGDDVFELESVPPEKLQSLLRGAIDSVIDVKAFNDEVEREKADSAHLEGVRKVMRDNLADIQSLPLAS